MRNLKLYFTVTLLGLSLCFTRITQCMENVQAHEKSQEKQIIAEEKKDVKSIKKHATLLATVIFDFAQKATGIYDEEGYEGMQVFLANLPEELKSKIVTDIILTLNRSDIFINEMLILFNKISIQPNEEKEAKPHIGQSEDTLISFFNQLSYECKLALLKSLINSISASNITEDITEKSNLLSYLISNINHIKLLLQSKEHISFRRPYFIQYIEGAEIPAMEALKNLEIAITNKLKELVQLLIPNANQIKDFSSDIKEKTESIIQAFKLGSEILNDLKNLPAKEKEEIIEYLYLNYFINNASSTHLIKSLKYALFPNLKHNEYYTEYHNFDIADLEYNAIFYFKIFNKLVAYYPQLIETLHHIKSLAGYDQRLYAVQTVVGPFLSHFSVMLYKLTVEQKYEQVVQKLFDLYISCSNLNIFQKALYNYYVEIDFIRPIPIPFEEQMALSIELKTRFIKCLKMLNEKIENYEVNKSIDFYINSMENDLAQNK